MSSTDRPVLLTRLADERLRTERALEPLSDVAMQIAGRLGEARSEASSSVPYRLGDHWYLRRRVPGHSLPQVCRRPACAGAGNDGWEPPLPQGDPAGWQVLLDGDELACGTGFADVAQCLPSPDGQLVAFTIDTTGGEGYDLLVVDGDSGAEVDRLHAVCPRFAWWPQGHALVYGTVDATVRPDTLRVHKVGRAFEQDVVAFHEPDPGRWVGVGASTSGQLLLVLSGSATTSEWWLLEGSHTKPRSRVLLAREPGVSNQVDHVQFDGADMLLILRRERGRRDVLQSVPLAAANGASNRATTLLTGTGRVQLEHLSASAAAVVLNVREDGIPVARVYRTSEVTTARWPEPAVTVRSAIAARPHDGAQPFVQVTRMSWTEPSQVVDVDVATLRETVRRQGAVPAGYCPDQYRVRRLLVATEGGAVQVPVTLLERRDQPRPAPLLLTVYGAYGAYDEPALDLLRLELLDRGLRVAIAHPRGGGELGPAWHDAARGVHKPRTIDDLLACARYLVNAGWTTQSELVLRGASAGGLAVAAAVNREPELFAGVAALVPFVDPLSSMLDSSMPLTTTEREEWGDPLADPGVRDAMARYSPMQNVRPVGYPPMYVTASLLDHRVSAEHVLDWVTRLRATGTTRGEIVLRTLDTGGHYGPSDPRQQIWEQALLAAWIVRTCGAG